MLKNIHAFVKGANRDNQKLTIEEHARCSLELLQTIPAARLAALEYLCHVFDESVNSYLYEMEGKGHTGNKIDDVITETHQILKKFIERNPTGWAPIISRWSIELLGRISSNYGNRRGVPHSSSLNEQLQLWMSCKGMRTLMELSSLCISVMIDSCPDTCVNAIIDTSVKHSPHFDWVVAHIGSCFPTTIINRVLSLGLRDFCSSQSGGHLVATEIKVPKMVSVVSILGHLAAQHSLDIKNALLKLFKESLGGVSEQQVYTVPFLLQLLTMSPVLLKTITDDFIFALTPEVLGRLAEQFQKSVILQRDKDTLLMLVIHLVSKSGKGAYRLINFMLDMAGGGHMQEEVQQACSLILDLLILELQRFIYSKTGSLVNKGSPSSEVPFLSELQNHTNALCDDFLKTSGKRVNWLQRFLAMLALHCGEESAADILSYVLINISENDKLSAFLSLQAEMEVAFPSVMYQAVKTACNQLTSSSSSPDQTLQILHNMHAVVDWEVKFNSRQRARVTMGTCLADHVPVLSSQLYHPDVRIASKCIGLINLVKLKDSVDLTMLHSLAQSVVDFAFILFGCQDHFIKSQTMADCKDYLQKLSEISAIKYVILRSLLENALKKCNLKFFHMSSKLDYSEPSSEAKPEDVSLLLENERKGLSVSVPKGGLSVFHAGVIGKGRRHGNPQRDSTRSADVLLNCQLLTQIIRGCSIDKSHPPAQSMPTVEKKPSCDRETASYLADVLVELVCPDVTFTGVLWPEEELTRLTIERDLHIRMMLDQHLFLWDILTLIAQTRTAMYRCSVILYGAMATLLAFWDSSRCNVPEERDKALNASGKLLIVLSCAGLLPSPLTYSSLLLSELSVGDIHLFLTVIWTFMKENPPKPDEFQMVDGTLKKSFLPDSSNRASDILHALLQKNIAKLGYLYPKIFPVESTSVSEQLAET
ncbi:integrator complex subunit 5-like isoform X2 [Apostichopus japonicus]